jgi:glycosyltransferase involved in cell wall biosynthesis
MARTIAILSSEPPTNPGGVEHVVLELVKGLESRGYKVLSLYRTNAAPHWVSSPKSRLVRGLGDALSSWYLGRKLRQLADGDLVAVISNGPIGWYVPKVNGNSPKKVHFYHGTYRAQAEAIRPLITSLGFLKMKWWDSMVIERACGAGKQVLCNSDQTREEVFRFFGHAGATIWLPLDVSHFRPMDQTSCRRKLGLPERESVGLFVGSDQPIKGLPVVRFMMRSLPGVSWLLVMKGSVPGDLAGEQQVRVFANAPHDLLPELYGAADFAVFPSRYESFGYVVAESLACGTPVIAAPGGASRLFLRQPPLDELLIPGTADPGRYVAAARRVLGDPERYKRAVMEDARPRVVEKMAPENWWPRFLEVTGL